MSGKSGKGMKMNKIEKSSSDELITCTPPELSKAASNARHDLLPSKSKSMYESAYTAFAIWRKKNKPSSTSESVLMAYFVELSKKYKPSTLWSIYSMLKSTINLKESINIGAYPILTAFLKKQSSGFQSKKSNVLSSNDVKRFLTEAPDNKYLITKVALIFGICGACRSNELVNIRLQDITKQGNLIVVNLPDTKTKRPRTFVIGEEFTETVKKYEALRPANKTGDRFFLNYQNGKCTAQVIGVHKFAKMPGQIATFLNLPNADTYTGHAFRRTSATLLADSGANIITLKRHGGWKSSSVAEGHIEESMQNKTNISSLLSSAIHNHPTLSTSITSATSPVPSISSISATSLLPSEAHGNSDESPPFKQRRMNKSATGASSTITTSRNKTTISNNCSERISANVVTKTVHSQIRIVNAISLIDATATDTSRTDAAAEDHNSDVKNSEIIHDSLQMNASEPIEHVNVEIETWPSETNVKVETLPSSSSDTEDPLKILPSVKPEKCILEEKIVTLERLLAEKSNTVRELQKKTCYQEQKIFELKSVINAFRKREYLRKSAEAEIK